jgi:pimeloyl-ACP methyl ester carboxylesterase
MENYFTYQNKKIYYSKKGKGQSLVLLHGFLESRKIWEYYTDELSKYFQVLTIDLPGHGQSENVADVHSMDMMAELVNELLYLQNVEKCVMIGHSMGGYVTLAFAKKFPEKLKGFALLHAAADSPETKINRGRTIQIVKENHKDFITNFIPELFSSTNRERLKENIEFLKNEAKKMNQNGIVAALMGMRERPDSYDVLKKFDKPILFIIGKKDIRTPMEMMQHQIYLPKISEVVLFEDVAHMGFLEAESYILEIIKGFGQRCNANS